MSRSFGIMGLPREFLEISKLLDLKVVGKHPKKEYFYSEGYSFRLFEDKNGVIYEEFEAGCPWDGGPSLYLGLREKDTQKVICSWTASQMGFEEVVTLPPEYTEYMKKALAGFVKSEETEFVKGYCPLYVYLTPSYVDIFQSLTSEYPNLRVLQVFLSEEAHGPVIRDYLTQEGFSIEELSYSANQYMADRQKYIDDQEPE